MSGRHARAARLALAAGAVTAAAALAQAAPAAAQSPAEQTTEGSVAAPLRFPVEATYQSWPGGHRQLAGATGANGAVGYTVELDPAVAGGTFELTPLAGATGLEDLDVTFYSSLNPAVSTGGYQTRGAGGEEGFVPIGSRYAIVTLFDGANARFRLHALAGDAAPKVPPVPEVPAPGIHADFGKGDSELAQRLRDRSQVVIALVDSGVNPYHVAFRRPENVVHPSEYVEGFPTDVPALGLNLGEPDYAKARAADDDAVWTKVGSRKLYWIPGTNVIAARSFAEEYDPLTAEYDPRLILDDLGHGTGVASVAAGGSYSYGTKAALGANPDALIVVLEGLGDDGVEWASKQPWIDFISGSYGDPAAVPANDDVPSARVREFGREYRHTGPFVLRDGRTACFSAGNGATRTGVAADRYSSLRPTSGPSWVVTVGAVSPRNRQDYGWHSVPVDVSSFGNHWPAADHYSTAAEQVFSGTSNATPVTCGVFSKTLLAARSALGDRREGIHEAGGERVPATGAGAGTGPLGDGVLTRTELQEAVLKTAVPHQVEDPRAFLYDPVVVPHTPLYYTQQGYGIADVPSAARAIAVLAGAAPLPDRAEVDEWVARMDSIRDRVYPPDRHDGR